MSGVGIPQNGQFQRLQKFKGLNTQAQRDAIDDQEFSWLENLMPIGDGNLRALPGPSPALYTAKTFTILEFFPFNIGSTYYHFVWGSDGSGRAVNTVTGAATVVIPSGSLNTETVGYAAQWGNQYLLIIDPTNGYWIWDGTAVYYGQSGNATNTASLAPVVTVTAGGSGYISGASASVSGGSGSGATFSVKVVGGVVISVTVTNAGANYLNGDTVTMTISPVSGGSGATATVSLMPTGLLGTDIEVYQNRVWLLNNANIQLSAPESPTNWATASGGDSFTATDSVLRVAYTAFCQSSGFLYPIADTSVDVINNVQTSSGGSTTFNNYNLDPQVGTVWRDSTEVYGRTIILANASGLYGIYGGSAQKISPQLDGVFATINANAFQPSSAVAVVFGVKLFCYLMNCADYTGYIRPIIFCWDGKKWFAASQNNDNIFKIATLNANGEQQCWASDGVSIFQCFTTPTTNIVKIAQTKAWSASGFEFNKEAQRVAIQAENLSGGSITFAITVDTPIGSTSAINLSPVGTIQFVNASGGVINFTNSSSGSIIWLVNSNQPIWANANQTGKTLGLTLTTHASDFIITALSLMFIETTAY